MRNCVLISVLTILWGLMLSSEAARCSSNRCIKGLAQLIGTDPQSLFGYSVALSGDGFSALIGAPEDNDSIGAGFVFVQVEDIWLFQAKLLPIGGVTGRKRFGSSVALSYDGNTAVLGAEHENEKIGAAYAFVRDDNGAWTQQQRFDSIQKGPGQFGFSAAISKDGNTAVFGALFENGNIGACHVFTRNKVGTWTEIPSGPLVGKEGFANINRVLQGASVAISADGNIIISGAPNNNDQDGAAWVFQRKSSNVWVETQVLTAVEAVVPKEGFGRDVAISGDGNVTLIGTSGNSNFSNAFVFTRNRNNDQYTFQPPQLIPKGIVGLVRFRASVALNFKGDVALLGVYGDNNLTGSTFLFTRNEGDIFKQQSSKFIGPSIGKKFPQGRSLALSHDGRIGLVGGDANNDNKAGWIIRIDLLEDANSPIKPISVSNTDAFPIFMVFMFVTFVVFVFWCIYEYYRKRENSIFMEQIRKIKKQLEFFRLKSMNVERIPDSLSSDCSENTLELTRLLLGRKKDTNVFEHFLSGDHGLVDEELLHQRVRICLDKYKIVLNTLFIYTTTFIGAGKEVKSKLQSTDDSQNEGTIKNSEDNDSSQDANSDVIDQAEIEKNVAQLKDIALRMRNCEQVENVPSTLPDCESLLLEIIGTLKVDVPLSDDGESLESLFLSHHFIATTCLKCGCKCKWSMPIKSDEGGEFARALDKAVIEKIPRFLAVNSGTNRRNYCYRFRRHFCFYFLFTIIFPLTIFLSFAAKQVRTNESLQNNNRTLSEIFLSSGINTLPFLLGGYGQTFLFVPAQYNLTTSPTQAAGVPVIFGVMHTALYFLGLIPVPFMRGFWRWLPNKSVFVSSFIPIDDMGFLHEMTGFSLLLCLFIGCVLWLGIMGYDCFTLQNSQACLAFNLSDPSVATNVTILRIIVWCLWFPILPIMFIVHRGAPLYFPTTLRRHWFEIWYFLHVLSALTVVILALFVRFSVFYPVLVSWSIYVLDWCCEILFHTHRFKVVNKGTKNFLFKKIMVGTRLQLKPASNSLPKIFQINGAGQYGYLMIPKLDFTWHPFSIAHVNQSDQTIEFYIKANYLKRGTKRSVRVGTGEEAASTKVVNKPEKVIGTWTNSINAATFGSNDTIYFRGPYGVAFNSCFDKKKYAGVVVIGSGSGLTAAESVLKRTIDLRVAKKDVPPMFFFVYQCSKTKELRYVWKNLRLMLYDAISQEVIRGNSIDWENKNVLDWLGVTFFVTEALAEEIKLFQMDSNEALTNEEKGNDLIQKVNTWMFHQIVGTSLDDEEKGFPQFLASVHLRLDMLERDETQHPKVTIGYCGNASLGSKINQIATCFDDHFTADNQ